MLGKDKKQKTTDVINTENNIMKCCMIAITIVIMTDGKK